MSEQWRLLPNPMDDVCRDLSVLETPDANYARVAFESFEAQWTEWCRIDHDNKQLIRQWAE